MEPSAPRMDISEQTRISNEIDIVIDHPPAYEEEKPPPTYEEAITLTDAKRAKFKTHEIRYQPINERLIM